jgi:hypothetical protein
MTSHPRSTRAEELACEVRRYLDVVETFAVLGADPHAGARARAARKRHIEERSPQTARKGVRRWTR